VLGKAVDRRGGRGLLAVSSLVFAAGLEARPGLPRAG